MAEGPRRAALILFCRLCKPPRCYSIPLIFTHLHSSSLSFLKGAGRVMSAVGEQKHSLRSAREKSSKWRCTHHEVTQIVSHQVRYDEA